MSIARDLASLIDSGVGITLSGELVLDNPVNGNDPIRIDQDNSGRLEVRLQPGLQAQFLLSESDGEYFLFLPDFSGQQAITASSTLRLQTTSNGNITLAPDGTGITSVLGNVDIAGDAVIDGGDILLEGTSFTTTLTYTEPTQANTLTLPDSSGTIALLTDLSGGGAGAVGGGADEVFWENDQTVTTDYTITNAKNAGSFGPITVDSGVTVTIGTGETWTIV